MMESEYIGFAGSKSDEYQRFQKLKSIASDEELKNLINHENPIIRTYSYLSLIERNLIKPSIAFEDALEINETFSEMNADQMLSSDICTEIYFDRLNNYINSELGVKSDKSMSSDLEMKRMDSLILYKLDDYHLLHFVALKGKVYNQMFNDRIVELALEFDNPSAIFYLNRNKIEVDELKLRESLNRVIDKNNIGTEPIIKLKKILIELNEKLK